MRFKFPPPRGVRIEIIPMIDVMFFLLVFFILSSLARSRVATLPVELPQTAAPHQRGPVQEIVLAVEKSGQLWLNDQRVTQETLAQELVHAFQDRPQQSLIIQADKRVSYEAVMQCMEIARTTGIRKFSLAMEQPSTLP